MPPGPTDDQLLRMLREVEDVEDLVDNAEAEAEAKAEEGAALDPCPFCGEPAEHLGTCVLCEMDGCLPPDLWSPGMNDQCLTLCVRCARHVHLGCAIEDEAGNPRCPTCPF